MAVREDRSLVAWRRVDNGDTALVFFPWAGAGAAPSRGLSQFVNDSVSVYGVRLPGRESRMREPLPRALQAVVLEVAHSIAGLSESRIALFGQCSGAILALEVAKALNGHSASRKVSHLFVASQLPPADVAGANTGVDARRFVPDEFMAEPEMMAIILPAIEADMALMTDYEHRAEDRLSVPMTILRGSTDDDVSETEARGWADISSARSEFCEVVGAGHLFGPSDWFSVAEIVNAALVPDPSPR